MAEAMAHCPERYWPVEQEERHVAQVRSVEEVQATVSYWVLEQVVQAAQEVVERPEQVPMRCSPSPQLNTQALQVGVEVDEHSPTR